MPLRPNARQPHPQETIGGAQQGPPSAALIDRELVAEREDFDLQRHAGTLTNARPFTTAITTACMTAGLIAAGSCTQSWLHAGRLRSTLHPRFRADRFFGTHRYSHWLPSADSYRFVDGLDQPGRNLWDHFGT